MCLAGVQVPVWREFADIQREDVFKQHPQFHREALYFRCGSFLAISEKWSCELCNRWMQSDNVIIKTDDLRSVFFFQVKLSRMRVYRLTSRRTFSQLCSAWLLWPKLKCKQFQHTSKKLTLKLERIHEHRNSLIITPLSVFQWWPEWD